MKYVATFLVFCFLIFISCSKKDQADLLLTNGKIWTGNSAQPWASWIALKGETILELGDANNPYNGEAIKIIDLDGRLALPGFNDSHVHFASAGHLLLNINLLDVNDPETFVHHVKETTSRLPNGSWISRGDWGAYEAWSMGSSGSDTKKPIFQPHRNMIDSITTQHPLLVTRYDRKMGLANKLALDFLDIESETGLLEGDELVDALGKIPEKSFEQRVAETNRGLEECRTWGVTTVQDMSPLDQISVYEHLRRNGELTCRINFAPSQLSDYKMMIEKGWVIDWSDQKNPKTAGDNWISFGTLKTHIDGIMGARSARFYEPYSDNNVESRSWRGGWREFSKDMPSFRDMIRKADSANIQMRIHAIGDEANSILLDILNVLDKSNGKKERRFRLVHAQVIGQDDFKKFVGRNVIAEVQPYHVTDDMRWMEERIGFERCKGAYAFKTLQEHGCVLSFGSDWPGTNASYYPVNPLMGLYAAVTRQTIHGEPEEGWFPSQRLSLEESLKAYTWGSSYGAFEEGKKGVLIKGNLADMAVLNTDLFVSQPSDWLKAKVDYTIVGGSIVYERKNSE